MHLDLSLNVGVTRYQEHWQRGRGREYRVRFFMLQPFLLRNIKYICFVDMVVMLETESTHCRYPPH
jgi:hypothetical protein